MTRYPLVDLAAMHRELGDELEAAVLDVVRSQQFIGGARVVAFEEAFSAYLGSAHAIGLGNGTDALELALRALDVGPGDDVLVPANTFIATAEAVVAAGATARFVDVEPLTGLIDLDAAAERLTAQTRAIIPVHLYGRMVDMEAVMAFAARHDLVVIEDAAQAHGARRNGRLAGTVSHVGCFSFYPGKNLGAFGDAGAAVTDDTELADRIRLLRDHGRRGRNTHEVVGVNSRLDPLHAAVLTIKLAHIDRWNDARREAAGWYREALPAGMLDPESADPDADVFHVLPILLEDRARVAAHLAQQGIQTGVHYESTVPSTQAFADPDRFPVAEERARMQLSLPMHPHLTREATDFIAGAVCDAVPTAIS